MISLYLDDPDIYFSNDEFRVEFKSLEDAVESLCSGVLCVCGEDTYGRLSPIDFDYIIYIENGRREYIGIIKYPEIFVSLYES